MSRVMRRAKPRNPRSREKSATDQPRRPSRRPKVDGAARALSGTTHVTEADGNVFADIGFPPEEAENLLIRSRLMTEIMLVIEKMTQVRAAALLGVSQPRVSDLKRGKIGLFTIDALVNMLAHAGVRTRVTVAATRPPR